MIRSFPIARARLSQEEAGIYFVCICLLFCIILFFLAIASWSHVCGHCFRCVRDDAVKLLRGRLRRCAMCERRRISEDMVRVLSISPPCHKVTGRGSLRQEFYSTPSGSITIDAVLHGKSILYLTCSPYCFLCALDGSSLLFWRVTSVTFSSFFLRNFYGNMCAKLSRTLAHVRLILSNAGMVFHSCHS